MSEELVFYTNPMSRGRIVRWALEEAGVAYRCKVLNYGAEMKTPEYLAINPMGKVPAITHQGVSITECAAICAYLADAFPNAELAPPPNRRGLYYRWLMFTAGPMEAATVNRSLGLEVLADQTGMIGYGTFELAQAALILAVSANRYVAGERFTMADIYIGSQIFWGLQMNSIDKHPAFEDYCSRLHERPAWRRATDLDDALQS